MELKQLTGTLAIEDLITPSELLSFQNASYNVLQFLKNVTALDLTNCTGLTALALAPMTWLVTLKVKNCTGLVVIDLAAQTRMTTLPQEAYKGCSALMTVVCPTSLLSIGQDAFANTDAMLEVKCTADRVLTGLADSGIVASKGSIFVNDDRVASYTGLEETVEPVSDWNKPALMWGDGTRIRFGSGETVLI